MSQYSSNILKGTANKKISSTLGRQNEGIFHIENSMISEDVAPLAL